MGILLLLILSLSVTSVSHAATYYVATSGGLDSRSCVTATNSATPKQTIASGLTCLTAGDTLYLRSGTYAETIDFNNQTIPSGTSYSNAVTVASYPGETATLAPVGGSGIFNLNASYIQYLVLDRLVLDGINLDVGGAPGTFNAGGLFTGGGAHHIRFQNGEIKNATGPLVQFYPNAGTVYQGFNEVINSKIHDAYYSYGFYIQSSDNLVDNNEIYNNGGYAVQVYNGYGFSTDNTIVRNNRMYNNGSYRNSLAVTVQKGTHSQVYNNLIYNNYGGIDAQDGAQLIYNNTVYNNTPSQGIEYLNSIGIEIKNNIVYQNGADIIDFGGNTSTVLSNNLTTDPSFINAGTSDFHLTSGSAAKDAGVSLSGVFTTDFDGVTRPQGSAWDIGAYEFVVGGAPVPHVVRVIR